VYRQFYREGICEIDFGDEVLDAILQNILNNDCKKDFNLITKYHGTFDLRPDTLSYDEAFIDALKKHDIKRQIKNITFKDYSLFHVQVRVVNNNMSYMDWHRDTYYDKHGNLVGKEPHALKLIYYPSFTEEQEDRLLYLLGSNRILFPTNVPDQQLFKLLKVKKIKSNNQKAILFDVNGLHAVCPEQQGRQSVRLIYSFLNKRQILDDHGGDELHMRTMSMYEEL